ncbi:MAG: TerB family tellurite resistance protein [Rhodothermales bacterium]|nr:TerB family tellurite resistance protein [Rhodothermales bacterium]
MPTPVLGAAAHERGAVPAPLKREHLHRLALLYITLAYGTDRSLHPAEQHAIVQLVRRWSPQTDGDLVEATVEAAFAAARTSFHASVEELATSLRPVLDPALRRQVLTDLGRVAKADGVLSVEEAALIGRIRAVWSGD